MSRNPVYVFALLVLATCGIRRPLYEGEFIVVNESPAPTAGGKGFVSPSADAELPPMSLTASDGSGLRLLALTANAMVDDPLAVTDLELRFLNPKDEVIEGKFELALPPGAEITRFAMFIGSDWQEAEIVERQKGRQVYETFLHQKRDPALLEKETGNRFGVRVFPIPASGEARLRVSYVQTFDEPALAYRLALAGLPRVGEIDARVGVKKAGSSEIEWHEHRIAEQRPREDFVVPRAASRRSAWRMGKRILARVTVPEMEENTAAPASIAILFDTSASRAIDFAGKIEQLERVVGELARRGATSTKLVVLPFDQTVGSAVYDGPVSDFAESDASARILRRQALGTSNFERALSVAARIGAERVVLVTDGMVTAGAREPEALTRALTRLAEGGSKRVDVIAGRDRRDDDVLHALVTKGLPQSGIVIDATATPETIAGRLLRTAAPPTTVRIAGAKHVWPAVLRGVQPGDAALVYAEVPSASEVLEVTLDAHGAEPVTERIAVRASNRAELTQAWVRADVNEQLEALARTGDRRNAALVDQLTQLSVEHRILNDLTALIVLETDEDYARFGIDRTGEPDVVADAGSAPPPAAGPDGVVTNTTSHGRTVSMEEFRNIPAGTSSNRDFTQVIEQSGTATRDAAGVSLAGAAGAESHYAAPRRQRVRRPKIARAELRSVRARNGLDRGHAKEIADRHARGVERCWYAGQTEGHTAGGSITVELHVDADGRVQRVDQLRARVQTTASLRRCLDAAFRSRRFDPGDAGRRVRYTFDLVAGEVLEARPEPVDAVVEDLESPEANRTDERSYEGRFAQVKRLLREKEIDDAAALAWAWRRGAPDDLMALVAIGEVAQAQGRDELAARAFGSIAELHPSDAAMLRFAAGRLESVGKAGLAHAIDALREAQRQRPDHPSSHRSLAWALAQNGRFEPAFAALARGYDNAYADGRFASARAEIGDELRIMAAAWLRAEPKKRATIEARLADLGLAIADEPSLRFVLSWETDANDVDLHVQDGEGDRAWYSDPQLASGGSLLADVTTGFGPESFVIDGEPAAYPYYLVVHYFTNGPMGYGMGHVQVIHHDGKGKLDIETLPFVAMKQDSRLLLGAIEKY